MLDASNWKEFRLCDLFQKTTVGKIKGKANDFPTYKSDEFCIPLLTAVAEYLSWKVSQIMKGEN